MKFATAKEHRDFFQKEGWIEFEDLISKDQLELANAAIDQILSERLNVPLEKLRFLTPDQIFLHGRDLWRSTSYLHKIVTTVRYAEIAFDLIQKKPLRLGYDQLYPSLNIQFNHQNQKIYSHFIEQSTSLEAVSCISGMVCGIVLNLGGKNIIQSEIIPSRGIDIFPKRAGQAIFFRPDIQVNWNNLHIHPNHRFYMIAYAQPSSRYQLQPLDPHAHVLKRLGYIFNDKLNDNLHPIVYR